MIKMKVILIFSGGLDSTTLLYDLLDQGHEIFAITYYYGQKHLREIGCAKRICEKLNVDHKIVDISDLRDVMYSSLTAKEAKIPEGHYEDENMKLTVVPNRNMCLISIAVSYAIGKQADYVYYGAHSGDHAIYHDCRPEFVEKMNEVIKICDWRRVELKAPYLLLNKGDIVKKGIELDVDYSLTHTCYRGGDKACGKCSSCNERLEAFEKAGIEDPIEYEKSL